MGKIMLVGMGGFAGSVLRYLLSAWAQTWLKREDLPIGTLIVNIIGCLAIGLLAQLAESRGAFSAEARAFVFVGILGGFTTFSAFGNETLNLWRAGQHSLSVGNIGAQLVLGLGAVWLGRSLGLVLWK